MDLFRQIDYTAAGKLLHNSETKKETEAAHLLDSRCSKINGGTFHSFANLTLRRYAKSIELDSSFTILDQGDSEDVINLIRGQLDLAKLKKRFPNKKTILNIMMMIL